MTDQIEENEVTGLTTGGLRSVSELDEEGDIAADYIEELLDIADLDGDIDITARNGRAYVSVNDSTEDGSSLEILSASETVNALQELTRLAVQNKTGEFSRLILDIGGSRAARTLELKSLVEQAIIKIEEGSAREAFPAMSSYERKLIHDFVSEAGYHSESEGEGRGRHIVVSVLL